MSLYIDKYLDYFADTPLSLEQKQAIVRIVWALLENQIDSAFEQSGRHTQPEPELLASSSPETRD